MTTVNTSCNMGLPKAVVCGCHDSPAFKDTETIAGSNGVILVNYERSGDVKLDNVEVT